MIALTRRSACVLTQRASGLLLAVSLLAGVWVWPSVAQAASVAGVISHQGLVKESGVRPTGSRTFRFKLYDADTGGALLWDSQDLNLTVTSGLYAVLLGSGSGGTNDPIGATVFDGRAAVYLEVTFQGAVLNPRERMASTAYAQVARTVQDGAVTESKLATNVAWKTNGNAGTTPATQFLGTTDNQALELRVNSLRALRLQPTAGTPNVIGGYLSNSVTAGATGGTVGGGGDVGSANFVFDDFGTVGGGMNNRVGDNAGTTNDRGAATVAGGSSNLASGTCSAVGGGFSNSADGVRSTVPGGGLNSAAGDYTLAAGRRAKVGAAHDGTFLWADQTDLDFASAAANEFAARCTGGARFVTGVDGAGAPTKGLRVVPGANALDTVVNEALEIRANNVRGWKLEPAVGCPNVIGGYSGNSATAGVSGATIAGGGNGGGMDNLVTDNWGTVGGGWHNQAGDGAGTTEDRNFATVGGGSSNTASGFYGVIGGGHANTADGYAAVVPGGDGNSAAGDYSLAAGRRAKVDAAHDGTFLWADQTNLDFASAIANEFAARCTGGARFVTGVDGGTGAPTKGLRVVPGANALDTVVNEALEIRANNVRGWRLEPDATSPNLIGGYFGNWVTAGMRGATIGGGGSAGAYLNRVTDYYGTVAGGGANQAGDNAGTILDNGFATVGGGYGNIAKADSSVVAGGEINQAQGYASAVPGGYFNWAVGQYSFAAGNRAVANHDGAFVWGDSTNADLLSSAANQFTARAAGGVQFFTNAAMNLGAQLAPNATAWSVLSDRNRKKNFHAVNGEEVLGKIARMPVTTWNYDSEKDTDVPHLGPTAQDFKGAFYPGRDDKSITTLEADGVHFAAIKALEARTTELKTESAALRAENAQLAARLSRAEALLEKLAKVGEGQEQAKEVAP